VSPQGNFEIFVNEQLVHSKRKAGHGFLVNNKPQVDVVLNAIEDAMAVDEAPAETEEDAEKTEEDAQKTD